MAAPPSVRTARPRRSLLDWLVFLAAVAAVAVIWLPFAFGVSPAGSDRRSPSCGTSPCRSSSPSRSRRVIRGGCGGPAFPPARPGLAACSPAPQSASTALFYARSFRRGDWPDPAEPRDWIALALPLAFLAAWAALMVRWRPDGRGPREASQPSDHDHAIVLMELAWLANAVPSLSRSTATSTLAATSRWPWRCCSRRTRSLWCAASAPARRNGPSATRTSRDRRTRRSACRPPAASLSRSAQAL